jgi:hypothetical protein
MEKSKLAFKQGFKAGWTLFCSPFCGAVEEIKAVRRRPKATNWRQFLINDLRLFLAPLIGAVAGLVKAFKQIISDL